MLGGLRPRAGVIVQRLQVETCLPRLVAGVDGEADGRVVGVKVLRGAHQRLTDGRRVAHGHRQGAQDAEVLPLSQTQPEIGAAELGGRGFQQVDHGLEADQRGELVQRRHPDPGSAQQTPGITTQVSDEMAVAAQRLSTHHRSRHRPAPDLVARR